MKKILIKYKTAIIMGLICGMCFSVGCALPKLVGMNWMDAVDQVTAPDVEAGEPVNILLLGIDARPGETNARSDTMILACVDPGKNKVALISIPRDSRVYVPGSVDKINSANAVGGPRGACRAVERLMGVDVDYYVLSNFKGFEKCIDILGGVTMDVEKRMYKPAEGINLRPGVQHLNGYDALAYVRWRGDALGDIGRTERQQKFIAAFTDELVKTQNILKLPALIPELKKNVTTNMGLKTMLVLAKSAANFKSGDLVGQTLPGYFYTDPDNHLSYWVVDKTKIEGMIAGLLEGKKVAVVEDAPYVPPVRSAVYNNDTNTEEETGIVDPTEPTDPVDPEVGENGEILNPDGSDGDEVTNPDNVIIEEPVIPDQSEVQGAQSDIDTPTAPEEPVVVPEVETPSSIPANGSLVENDMPM